jgi:hypothetical protein
VKFFNKKFNLSNNIALLEHLNLPSNDRKIPLALRSITLPYEAKEIISYKSCDKTNYNKNKNLN